MILRIYFKASPMPSAPLLWLVVRWMFLFSLLKFVWCPDAVSLSHVLQTTVILARMLSVLVAKACYLACLLRPIWHLGGPSSNSGGLGSTRRETLGFQAWISIDFGGNPGPPFGRFLLTLEQQLCFLACVFAGHAF